MKWTTSKRASLVALLACGLLTACPEPEEEPQLAEGIYGQLGEVIPTATAAQKATFERGREVALKRFSPEDGLGPNFNVSFCTACHEKPTVGGSSPRYRNFLLVHDELPDGSSVPVGVNGVLPQFSLEGPPRRPTDETADKFATRNGIPFFGVGLLAEIPDEEILKRADPDDADGDGISGRPNWDRGFVGRFGRKAQTVSIEGFIRGPLFNHLGVTSDPLSNELKGQLPVPSALPTDFEPRAANGQTTTEHAQAAAPDEPTVDEDGVPDPELSEQELFDLVSFAMLLAAPEPEPETPESRQGKALFTEVGCASCHTPALLGPRGLVPAYTDLLLHDMGDALADGIPFAEATGREYRTAPLWGVVATGPWLHDGRADTLDEAIRMHGGEGDGARERYEALSTEEQLLIVEFLSSLGGREQVSTGLLPPDAPVPAPGEYGGPARPLDEAEMAEFVAGREVFDRDEAMSAGLGPRFNGDSCRACHSDPVIGGSGGIDLNVSRQVIVDEVTGEITAPAMGTVAHRLLTATDGRPPVDPASNFFEVRQAPTTFGLGLIDRIPEATILAGEDPDDADGDGIRGIAQVLGDGRVGRLGWKADVPSVEEFLRDAMTTENGMTVPARAGQTFGSSDDDGDAAPDPELGDADYDAVLFYMRTLAPPPRQRTDVALEDAGEQVFETIGCATCHTPSMPADDGTPVNLYSDLLVHEVLPEGALGIPVGLASERAFRTAPLWGISTSAPYMHHGRASTLQAAIEAHDGEAAGVRDAFLALDAPDREALLAFLRSL